MAFLGSAVNRVGWACSRWGTGSWMIGVWWCTICEVVQNALVGDTCYCGQQGQQKQQNSRGNCGGVCGAVRQGRHGGKRKLTVRSL